MLSEIGGIRSIYLNNFRSYTNLILETHAPVIIITGENGTGKTNLLEAVSLLSPSKGLRKAKLQDISHKPSNTKSWGISANLFHNLYGDTQFGVGDLGQSDTKKIIRMNGETLKTHQELGKMITQLWLTPAMDRFVVDAPSVRREFIDHVGWTFHLEHGDHISTYEQAIKERSKLLKDGIGDPIWLDSLEKTIAQTGVSIVFWRQTTLDLLQKIIKDLLIPSGFPSFDFAFEGEIENWSKIKPALEIENLFRQHLKESRELDAIKGGTSIGPHRSDLSFMFHLKNIPGYLCSTGEQKILILGLVLSSIKLLELKSQGVPLLLLDEVIAHLDTRYRGILFDQIKTLKVQTWMSGIDKQDFRELESHGIYFSPK
jgi:DNA replication and repair protein RecF